MLSEPREQRQEQSRTKASNPNIFIPKSNDTIPAYKAERKQGRLQGKQHFPCLMDCATARTHLPVELVLQNQGVKIGEHFKAPPIILKKYCLFLQKHRGIPFYLSLGYYVETRCASAVCFRFQNCTCWFSDLWLVFSIKPFLGQLHACIMRCLGSRLETLLFFECAICTLDKRCKKSR